MSSCGVRAAAWCGGGLLSLTRYSLRMARYPEAQAEDIRCRQESWSTLRLGHLPRMRLHKGCLWIIRIALHLRMSTTSRDVGDVGSSVDELFYSDSQSSVTVVM